MRKTSLKRRSSSNPGRLSQQDNDRNSMRTDPRRNENTMIPRPKVRSSSSDRLSTRKSNLKLTTGKISIGQYGTAAPITPLPSSNNRYALAQSHERPTSRPSSTDHPVSYSQKGMTPKAGSSRHTNAQSSDGRVRASSAERALALAPKTSKKDLRPLSDKNYQNFMLNKIDNFFQSISPTAILNPNGSVKPLTLKIFVEVTNLLAKLFDLKSQVTISNYVDEIPKMAKKLHYPGSVNKSWLKTANTMHSWPHALGWMCWLVEMCEVKDYAGEHFGALDRLPFIGETEEDKEKNKNTLMALMTCYRAWNDESCDQENHLLKLFLKDEAERMGVSDEKYEQARLERDKALDKLRIEQEKVKVIDDEVTKLQEAVAALTTDRNKQKMHRISQKEHIQKLKKDIESTEKEKEMWRQEIEKLRFSKENLCKIIKSQPMTTAERDSILQSNSEKQNYLKNFETHLEEIRKEAYKHDIRLASSNNKLVQTILAYNQDIFNRVADAGGNVDELQLPESGICESGFLDQLKEKKFCMEEFMRIKREKYLKTKTLCESKTGELKILIKKKETLFEEAGKKREIIKKRKQELEIKETKKREKIKKLQQSNDELDECIQKVATELELINQQILEYKDKEAAVLRKKTYIEESSKRFAAQFVDMFDNHRIKLMAILDKRINKNVQS